MLSRQRPNESAGSQRRFRVLPSTLDTGEILPALVDACSWIPVRVATRWVVRRRRWRSMPSTLTNDLRSLGLLYSWASGALERDFDDHLEDGQPVTGMQIEDLLAFLRVGKARGDLLRIWRFRQGAYYLVKEDKTAEPGIHLSAGGFHYQGKAYLHVMRRWDGTGYQHEDEFFRIESGRLMKLTPPKGLPLVLAPGEGVWKGFFETFEDDDLEFQFGIWKNGDANCCPTAGWVKRTYTIAGDELKYATWNRSKDVPQ